jgi:hypothetical protein
VAIFVRCFDALDPDEETLARFYALLALIPKLRQMESGQPADEFEVMAERAEREGAITARLEGTS